eukprot:Gb_25229 [translate_table: standard]
MDSGKKMADIYAKFCEIVPLDGTLGKYKAPLAIISDHANSEGLKGHAALNGLYRLKSQLDSSQSLMLDFRQFALFYRFVFFMCCEWGQKSMTVSTAIEAWRLILSGRFRLLDQWCDFVQKHQRHNISEDTWLLVLEFSRFIREDLQGYDIGGAWPILIDEFVDHMYRKLGSCTPYGRNCKFNVTEISNTDGVLSGTKLSSGFKRSYKAEQMESVDSVAEEMQSPLSSKRARLVH